MVRYGSNFAVCVKYTYHLLCLLQTLGVQMLQNANTESSRGAQVWDHIPQSARGVAGTPP